MQKLIVDTNLVQFGANEMYTLQVAELFSKLSKKNYEFYISAHSIFEVYRGIDTRKVAATKGIVDMLNSILPDMETYKIAAALTTCYNRHPATKNHASSFSVGDLFIAASAFRDSTHLLTANANDFPYPFFYEVERFYLENEKSGVKLPVAIMAPSVVDLNEAVLIHYPQM